MAHLPKPVCKHTSNPAGVTAPLRSVGLFGLFKIKLIYVCRTATIIRYLISSHDGSIYTLCIQNISLRIIIFFFLQQNTAVIEA